MILHVDMDAFYASVEERDRPELRGLPLIVGGTPEGRGVVAAANYAVREFGVHSAMSTRRALQLCPQARVLPVRMQHYAEIARRIREIFRQFTPLVEPLSLDEAFLDVSGTTALFGSPEKIGRLIQAQIADRLQLVASVGIAPNKFLAKIASDLDKPSGFVVVDPNRVQVFLDPLPIKRLWGVGRVTEEKLQRRGLHTIGDLRRYPSDRLTSLFGEQGEHLSRLAQGIDKRCVVPDRDARSISHETTFPSDIQDLEELQAWTWELGDQVARRLRRLQKCCRTVHLKIRYDDFDTITRATTLPTPSQTTQSICEAAIRLLTHKLPDRKLSVRLLGVGVSGLATEQLQQRSLFPDPEVDRNQELDEASDEIRDRFGAGSLSRGSSLLRRRNEK